MSDRIKVGQVLWWVPTQRWGGAPREVTVKKVGRKWADIGSYRIEIDTLIADGNGYAPPGRCYVSREAYEADVACQAAFDALRKAIQYISPPKGVTTANIKEAARLLRVEI